MVPGLGDVLESSLIQGLLEQLLQGFQAKGTQCCSLFLGKCRFGPRLLQEVLNWSQGELEQEPEGWRSPQGDSGSGIQGSTAAPVTASRDFPSPKV